MIRFWARLTLLQRFAITSAVIAAGLTVLLSVVTVRAIDAFAIKDESQVAAELVLRTISPQLRPSDLQGFLPPERRTLLDTLFRAQGISDTPLRVRLWRADGTLLYSNLDEPPGLAPVRADLTTPAGYQQFVEAREEIEQTASESVRFFVPVQVAGDARSLGAFEIIYDVTLVRQRLASTHRTIWIAVPLGMAVLYASVFVLVGRASKQMLKHQADLVHAHLGTYHSLATAIDTKDSYTGDHAMKIADIAVQVAESLGMTGDDLEDVRMGARLHDVGNIAVPDTILMKVGPLSPDELEVMRKHAEAGSAILAPAPLSAAVKLAVRHTHERWDGQGYPDRLAGEDIPLIARIVAVADAYKAMTSDRPYRQAMPHYVALDQLRTAAGTQFDPTIVEFFCDVVTLSTIADEAEWEVKSLAKGT